MKRTQLSCRVIAAGNTSSGHLPVVSSLNSLFARYATKRQHQPSPEYLEGTFAQRSLVKLQRVNRKGFGHYELVKNGSVLSFVVAYV